MGRKLYAKPRWRRRGGRMKALEKTDGYQCVVGT